MKQILQLESEYCQRSSRQELQQAMREASRKRREFARVIITAQREAMRRLRQQ